MILKFSIFSISGTISKLFGIREFGDRDLSCLGGCSQSFFPPLCSLFCVLCMINMILLVGLEIQVIRLLQCILLHACIYLHWYFLTACLSFLLSLRPTYLCVLPLACCICRLISSHAVLRPVSALASFALRLVCTPFICMEHVWLD